MLNKAIKRVTRILEKKSSTTHKELQVFSWLFFFRLRLFIRAEYFSDASAVHGGNICIGLGLLQMIYYGGKSSYLDRIESYFYPLTAHAIPYGQTLLAFTVKEDTSCLDILLYNSSARTCLPATKSVLPSE